jgi:hypothetical protein
LALTIKIVSTVLRPVGPLDPRVYWIRRAVLSGVILVVIIVIAVSCSGGSTKKPPATGPHTSPTTSASPPAQLAACDPTALTLTLSTDSETYTSGQAPKLIGVFANTTSVGCKLTVAASNEDWTIKSGTAKVWTTQGCSTSTVAKQITIRAGATKMVSVFWNGHLLDSGCASGAVATAGTYTLNATLDGVKGKIAVFHIT